MRVISLHTLLPKNFSFVTQKFVLSILPSSDNFILKSFIGSSLTLDRGFRASTIIGPSAVVDVNNINRARYILQSTLCTLFIKLHEATSVSKADLSLFDWLTQKSKDNTSFLHWKWVTNLVLLYVRFICEVSFKLHA